MEVPTNVQARIAEIRSRFDPGAAAPTSSSTSSSEFATVLAQQLTSPTTTGLFDPTSAVGDGTSLGTATDPSTGSTSSSLLSARSTLASSGTSLGAASGYGLRTVRDAASAYGLSGVAATGPIASTRAVANLEGMYENGRLPDEALTDIGVGSHRLSPPAASAFVRLRAAARADGIDIKVTDSYRSYDQQVDVARRKGLYSQGGLAAKPGTSDHGLGLALDLDLDPEALTWMRTNAARFGFVEDTPRESWHWKFAGV